MHLAGDRLQLVTTAAASNQVERLLARLRGGTPIEPLDLPETVWLVLAIVVLDQPITRAEITARRMADSDRQVQVRLHHGLIREEPRAALPGCGIPLVTTELLLRRLGAGSLSELQRRVLAQPLEAQAARHEARPEVAGPLRAAARRQGRGTGHVSIQAMSELGVAGSSGA